MRMTSVSSSISCDASIFREPDAKRKPWLPGRMLPQGSLPTCINVLATYADNLPDEQFRPMADRILEWADRFDRAPGREQVLALTLALIQFNRGMILLRLGRTGAAREALNLARSVDPIVSEIEEATRLTSYDQHARELAARVRARPSAA